MTKAVDDWVSPESKKSLVNRQGCKESQIATMFVWRNKCVTLFYDYHNFVASCKSFTKRKKKQPTRNSAWEHLMVENGDAMQRTDWKQTEESHDDTWNAKILLTSYTQFWCENWAHGKKIGTLNAVNGLIANFSFECQILQRNIRLLVIGENGEEEKWEIKSVECEAEYFSSRNMTCTSF